MRAKNEIKLLLKIDTSNYTDEIKGWHFDYDDEEEALYTIEQLRKHYKYVDYYTGENGYYIYASNTINYGENPCDVNYKKGQ